MTFEVTAKGQCGFRRRGMRRKYRIGRKNSKGTELGHYIV